jgi:hypothetical protein
VKQAEKAMQEQIASLRDEKTRLQVQIEMLSSKENSLARLQEKSLEYNK